MPVRSLALILYSGMALAVTASSKSLMLAYSTYLHDNFTPNAIAADSYGNIYLADLHSVGCGAGRCVPLTLYPFEEAGPGFGGYVWANQ
jgi:hypothetical protein